MTSHRPYVVAHVAVSLDSATTGFQPDVERFYALAGRWSEDLTLAGADTILAQETMLVGAPRPGPTADGPLLAVVDSRRRVRAWSALRECGHWRDVVALRGAAEPADDDSLREIVTDGERVDLAAALAELARDEGVERVRVDSGGGLVGALLDARVVDELSLLVHPVVVGDAQAKRWHPTSVAAALELVDVEAVDGLAWLRYRVS